MQLLIAADSLHGVTIRHMLIGGEALPQATAAQLLELFASNGSSMPLITNVYGPTETCVDASVFHIVPGTLASADDGGYVPIGKPLGNNRVYIVDSHDRMLPIGVKGELCIAGDGVGRGYLNLPELTGEKFVADPFVIGERMYKTGDLARYLPDGNIEYAGRKDHQVKIRGYRIELGEVEAALLNIEHVQEAVILARENAEGQSDLYAYFTGEKSLPINQLKEKLSDQIPGYMVPSYLMQLEQMPLTSNGKVNRSALPLPEAGLQTGIDYVAPRTKPEEQLVHIWKEVLKVEQVGVKDNFFDLGGHSLRG